MKTNISLTVKDFRAIKNAEIKINGITVVAGINGSGKSTLSKLLYYVFHITNNLSFSINKQIEKELGIFERATFYLLQSSRKDTNKYMMMRKNLYSVINHFSHSFEDDALYEILSYLDDIGEYISSTTLEKNEINRLYRIYLDLFKNSNNKPINIILNDDKKSLLNLITVLREFIIKIKERREKFLITRPKNFLEQEIKEAFNTDAKPEKLEVIEYDVPIISQNNLYMKTPFSINNVIYIDTPMLLGKMDVAHWKHTNLELRKDLISINEKKDSAIQKLINHDVLQDNGFIEYDDNRSCFVFKSNDSKFVVDLEDCATGIKAFGIINILLKNKSINEKTLLILDEPETHLHPQWIVEYARLLTLIQKHIGTKIFVVTHSPDMVQSLKFISNKEKINDKVIFYNAELANDNLQYSYKELGENINDIFDSFNISYEKLELYGED